MTEHTLGPEAQIAARLIAKAPLIPELVEVLETCLDVLENISTCDADAIKMFYPDYEFGMSKPARDKVRAVLAKYHSEEGK